VTVIIDSLFLLLTILETERSEVSTLSISDRSRLNEVKSLVVWPILGQ
jgi:hypothetical protein